CARFDGNYKRVFDYW
nr:immunoglobulin heavy chain junction region [Macaca mulatta]